jgi:hypothetical protein
MDRKHLNDHRIGNCRILTKWRQNAALPLVPYLLNSLSQSRQTGTRPAMLHLED